MTALAPQIEPHLTRLARYARALVSNQAQAEDLVQETVMRALEKAHLYKTNDNLPGWLVTIMHNEHVNSIRRSIRGGTVLVSDGMVPELGRPGGQEAPIEVREIRGAVRRLPRRQREPLVLHWIHDLTYDEIARQLHLPMGTVQSRISRARKALRIMLDTPNSGLGLANDARRRNAVVLSGPSPERPKRGVGPAP